ncbi:MAG TPA: hypothetical protein VFV41_20990 [Streptosporangiaceae bacterium]|nr:hypothetical protein [Streptosporangiaceae bacterium]
MNPPTEQLIRDYLNRVSVAARGRLGADQRRALIVRTREFIEQNTRAVGQAGSAAVTRLLDELGDPASLVEREREQLAGPEETGGSGAGEGRRRRSGRRHLADLMAARTVAVAPGTAEVPEPAEDAPLTGEIQYQARPITSRWKPGAPLVPKQARPPGARRSAIARRLPGHGRDGGDPAQAGTAGDPAGEPAGSSAAAAVPPLPADPPLLPADVRPARPQWPSLTIRPAGNPPAPANGSSRAAGPAGTTGPAAPARLAPGDGAMTGEVVPDGPPAPDGPPDPLAPDGPLAGESAAAPGPAAGTAARPLAGRPRDGAMPGDPARPGPGPAPGRAAALGAQTRKLAVAMVAVARHQPLEATAVVLLGLGGLIYPPVWLMGAAVALASRVWDHRDKWIGLGFPVILVIAGIAADVSLGGSRAGLLGYLKEAWLFGGHISRIAALLGAVYLAWRAQRGRRPPAIPPWKRPRRIV